MPTAQPHPQRLPRRRPQAGFTLFETILSIGILALAAVGMKTLQGGIFTAQTAARDLVAGTELQQACAERLLGVRRQSGFLSVNNALCNGIGGVAGFAANPAVSLTDANGSAITGSPAVCTSATCTIKITIAKSSGPAAPLPALTLRLSNY